MADLTGLDRVGVPVYSAIVPRSNDNISVYSGKGQTAIDAKTSAVMEAVERFAGGLPIRPTVIASYEQLAATGRSILNPSDHNIEVLPQYRDDLPLYWVTGHDILNDERVLVPYGAVSYVDTPGTPPCYRLATSNGLASGNSIEEAICHALCELIERDALTLAEVVRTRLRQVLTSDRAPTHIHIDLDTTPLKVQQLVEKFHRADLRLELISITSDLGIPSMLALEISDDGPMTSKNHSGLGTHPDVEIAMSRAITECAQSRAVDIQSLREDIALPDAEVSRSGYHAKRSSTTDMSWLHQSGQERVAISELASYPSDDIVGDIQLMLGRLRSAGISRAIVVDVSPPEIPAHVVRVIAPGLECWSLDRSKLGFRAADAWNQAVRSLMDGRQ